MEAPEKHRRLENASADRLQRRAERREKRRKERQKVNAALHEKNAAPIGEDAAWGAAPFIRLDKNTRTHLSRESVRTGSTLVGRWLDMGQNIAPGLMKRAEIAAGLIEPGRIVADIGCGAMLLERTLPPNCTYIPVDCVPRDIRTLVVDLNKTALPLLNCDIVVGLGVLEYLADMPGFVGQIRREAIFSYAPVESAPKHDRASSGWFNSYTVSEMDNIFEAAGFRIKLRVKCPGRHLLWHLDFVG
jgi:hypothetical protein